MKQFMQVSSKSQYALRLVSYIASSKDKYVSLAEVSENENISYGYLEEIVVPLKNHGILSSKAGRSGGYTLAKRASKIKISDIVNAIEGKTVPVKCLGHERCDKEKNCKARAVWKTLKDNVDSTLGSIKLSDIL